MTKLGIYTRSTYIIQNVSNNVQTPEKPVTLPEMMAASETSDDTSNREEGSLNVTCINLQSINTSMTKILRQISNMHLQLHDVNKPLMLFICCDRERQK